MSSSPISIRPSSAVRPLRTRNEVWLLLVMLAQDLVAWTKALCLADEAQAWELKRLRYRLLHQAGRIARHARRTRLPGSRLALVRPARRRLRTPANATRRA